MTSNFHLANCEADFCRTGIKLTSDTAWAFKVRNVTPVNHTGQVSNFTMQGGTEIDGVVKGFPQSCGVRTGNTDSRYNRVHCSNVRLTLLDINGVRVDGSDNLLTFDGLWVDSWNTSGAGWPGVEAAAGSTVLVGGTKSFTDGQGAPNGGGAGTVTFIT